MLQAADLTLDQKLGQMVMGQGFGRFWGLDSPEFKALHSLVTRHHLGGLKIYHGYALGTISLLNHLQQAAQIPLLVAADFERGVGQQIADAPPFPPAAALGKINDPQLVNLTAKQIGQEAQQIGVNTLFGPLLDLHTAEDHYFGLRSLGSDPSRVAHLGAAYLLGATSAGVLAVPKYFPGHGRQVLLEDRSSLVPTGRRTLETVDMLPFQQLIQDGLHALMVSHGAFPELDSTDWPSQAKVIPASLSKTIVTEILRRDLGFEGLIVTDALNIPFLLANYSIREVACQAVAAGADLLVALGEAGNVQATIQGIKDALDKGLIDESSLDDRVDRILNLKKRVILDKAATSKITDTVLGGTHTIQVIEEIAWRSVTLLKKPSDGYPLTKRPLNLPVLLIGSCDDYQQIVTDPWQPWHRTTYPQDVSFTLYHLRPGEEAQWLFLNNLVETSVLIIPISEDPVALDLMMEGITELDRRSIRSILLLSFPWNLASNLAPRGWASIWVADATQASRCAAISAVLGQADKNVFASSPDSGRKPDSVNLINRRVATC